VVKPGKRKIMKYKVIEDNGGGLHLYVFERGGRCIWAHNAYEYSPGNLSDDLDALEAGDDPRRDWEGGADDPQALYESISGYEFGWEIVAEGSKRGRKLYKGRMGVAAQIEFGVSDDERDTAMYAAMLGSKGGAATSPAKAAAARANGRKGGRPRKTTTTTN
jgi:hypothetical protein